MISFFQEVYGLVERVPHGKVVSYGQIAQELGRPGAAREVGRAMRFCPEHLPWQRVVMSDGSITGGDHAEMRSALLESEDVAFLPDGRVDMKACGFSFHPGQIRCGWVGGIPEFVEYHDKEWGQPVHDDHKLFEMLILEGMQAGLSWLTVLKKREAFRQAFDGFDPHKVMLYDNTKIEELMADQGIIRNRLKINSAVINARLFLEVAEKYGSFDKFIWGYVDYTPIINRPKKTEDIPATTPLSDKISKDLKKMGFKFVGSTIIYAFMQATGMVDDHAKDCFICESNDKAILPRRP